MRQITPLLLAGAAVACASAPQARADDDRFSLTVSAFRPSSDTTLSAGSADVMGQAIDFEDTFSLGQRETRPRLDGMLRLGDRHRLIFNYYDLKRGHSAVLDEDIEFDGQVFPVDTDVSGRFDFTLATLSYEYALVETPTLTVGAQIGAHWAEVEAGVRSDGEPIVDAGTSASGGSPALGLRVLGTPGEHWRFGGYVQAFKADVSDIDARFTRAGVFAEYRFVKNVGVQVGYDWFNLKADYAKTSWDGKLDLDIRGPTAGLTFAF
ncbi:MAG: hypothetical protein J0L88_15500 [Xanthomonadales bacterium]|nr:hypothetical protein [Xanthomonadales bacterium]